MSETHLPVIIAPDAAWAGEAPDPLTRPELFDEINLRRVLAYLIDVVFIGLLCLAAWIVFLVAGILTLGAVFLLVPLLSLIPIAYHTLQIGGPHSATLGMRFLGVEVRRWDGGRPDLVQALVVTLLYYATIALTTWLVLLVCLFNPRGRAVHDFLSGTLVVRRLSPD